jgi:general secretion pathway protein C
MVFGEAKVVGIFADRVELNRNGQIEILTLDDAPDFSGASSGSDVASTEISVDGAELDVALQNLPLLLTQARAVPYFKDGKAVGLRMFSIKAGSLYEKVGLQNGDILKTINGNSLSDMSQAMRLFEMLKQEKSLSVSLERNREEKEFKYQIK